MIYLTLNNKILPETKRKTIPPSEQAHVHEFLGSTEFSGPTTHNHRITGITSQAIPIPNGKHKHSILANTDFTVGHLHELEIETGPSIDVGNGKHIHFVEAITTNNLEHSHNTTFATLINAPAD